MRPNTDAESPPITDADDNQIFIAILHFNEVTVGVVEVEAARESLVIGSVWGMARERMQDNDEEKLQNTGEDDNMDPAPQHMNEYIMCIDEHSHIPVLPPAPARAPLVPERTDFLEGAEAPAAAKVKAFLARALEATGRVMPQVPPGRWSPGSATRCCRTIRSRRMAAT